MLRRWLLYGAALASLGGLTTLSWVIHPSSVPWWYWPLIAATYTAWAIHWCQESVRSDKLVLPGHYSRFTFAMDIVGGMFWPLTTPAVLRINATEFKEIDNGRHRREEADHQGADPSQAASVRSLHALTQLALYKARAGAGAMTTTPAGAPWGGDPAAQLFDDYYRNLVSCGSDAPTAMNVTTAWFNQMQRSGNTTQSGLVRMPLLSAEDATAIAAGAPEIVEEDTPILAHRAARIQLIPRQGPKLRAINDSLGYLKPEMDAECRSGYNRMTVTWGAYASGPAPGSGSHAAPDWNCQCGFYAVPSDEPSWHDGKTVDLLVELSGTIIEHERGYRAGHQKIMEVVLPPCKFCSKPSDYVMFKTDQDTPDGYCCAMHTPKNRICVSSMDLAQAFGVPVSGEKIK